VEAGGFSEYDVAVAGQIGGRVVHMTALDLAFIAALALVAVALQRSIPIRGFAWRYPSARLPVVAELALVVALLAGLLWGPEARMAAILLAGWTGGMVVGTVLSALRPQSVPAAEADEAASLPPRGR